MLNGNWVADAEPYSLFQSWLLDVGIGEFMPEKARAADGSESWWVNPAAIRGWNNERLCKALNQWLQVLGTVLYYGNVYQIRFVLPQVDARIAELRAELIKRATPRIMAEVEPAKTIKGYWDVKEVRAKVDPFDIYAQLLPDLELSGKWLRAACPLHTHKTAPAKGKKGSLAVGHNGYFTCHNCGAKGTVFDFVMQLERLPFAEAVNRVAQLGAL